MKWRPYTIWDKTRDNLTFLIVVWLLLRDGTATNADVVYALKQILFDFFAWIINHLL